MNSVFLYALLFLASVWIFYFHVLPFVRRLIRGKSVAYIAPKDLDLKIKSHAEMVMIDLRTDYNDRVLGFINGTVSLPFAKFMNKIVNDADALAGFKQVPIVLIGIRDEKEIFLAYKALNERGFSDVCVLDNGITEWLRAKLPTVRPYVPKND